MARIRTIKPEFFTNEKLSTLPEVTHYGMAAGLLTHSDDEGYFNANPGLIRAALFPLRDTSVSIHDMLTQLSVIGFIQLIDGPDGRKYGHVVEFSTHQRVNRPTPSKIKKILKGKCQFSETHGVLTEDSLGERKGKEQGTGNGKEGKGDSAEASSAPVIELLLNTGEEFQIHEHQCAEWGKLFPAVDVPQELRNMRAWCLANPRNRKTRSGALRFVTSWLTRAQNGAKPTTHRSPTRERADNSAPGRVRTANGLRR